HHANLHAGRRAVDPGQKRAESTGSRRSIGTNPDGLALEGIDLALGVTQVRLSRFRIGLDLNDLAGRQDLNLVPELVGYRDRVLRARDRPTHRSDQAINRSLTRTAVARKLEQRRDLGEHGSRRILNVLRLPKFGRSQLSQSR